MKLAYTIFLLLLVASGMQAQSANATLQEKKAVAAEISKLRNQYVKATEEYKSSLKRLLELYKDAVVKAEARAEQAEKLRADKLMSAEEVARTRELVSTAKAKVTETEQQIASTDQRITQTLNEIDSPQNRTELLKAYRRSARREPSCRNWSITAYKQERRGSVVVGFRFTCQR